MCYESLIRSVLLATGWANMFTIVVIVSGFESRGKRIIL